jgi:lysyl-tRNA synthetase class 2
MSSTVAPAPGEPGQDWRPTASIEALRLRAGLLQGMRRFFAGRGVLEVETPALCAIAATDPGVASLRSTVDGVLTVYLQSSPEPAMKRLVAAYGVPIYQLCKAFRDGERGSLHNPEFTILEWYRPGWDHLTLMAEVEDLLDTLLGTGPGRRVSYREAFLRGAGCDPFVDSLRSLRRRTVELGLDPASAGSLDRDGCLDYLFSAVVQPALSGPRLVFVHDFPPSQAALARIRQGDPPVAERFEAFLDGIELANGYHELADPVEQRRRFLGDLARRRARGLHEPPVDERLLAALAAGLPACAGVALGVDRLVMAATGATRIDGVLTFPLERA